MTLPRSERGWLIVAEKAVQFEISPYTSILGTSSEWIVKLKGVTEHKFFRTAMGVALAVLCGLAVWKMPLGEAWVNASYDYLFRFGARAVTNKVVLILMDDAACLALGQVRTNWDRALHAELLRKLTEGGCDLVVFDVFFRSERKSETDVALAEAMRRHGRVVLMAKVTDPKHPILDIAQVILPHKLFLDAAAGQGIGQADANVGETARRHWPFPAQGEGEFLSLPWTAARLAGARLNEKPEEQWLRYYGENGSWEAFSYHLALSNAPGDFRDKIVFIGSKPKTPVPGDELEDEFRTPYTRWTGASAGGVEILATSFLNLMNGEWLRRPDWKVEALLLIATGVLLGGGLCLVRPLAACGFAAGAALLVTLGAVSWSYFTNFWFPWLVIAGGQVPCALTWALVAPKILRASEVAGKTVVVSGPVAAPPDVPDAPDYELVHPPFGEGAYGKVWLARNAIGQWQALKAVYQAKFGQNTQPYESEFRGIKRYKPVSDKHPGLLRVDFVSRKKREGHFYYVMELGDALAPGWEENPATYKPRDLASARAQAEGRRLPVRECVRIGTVLAEALDFLHRQGLTHRDIKPSNIIFVNGQPKLADVGLVTEIRPPDQVSTWAGTAGYMPPAPEPPGTAQADIYALGMVLYVISTGREPAIFPELSTTLVERTGQAEFIRLNAIILQACQPDCAQRYAAAAEMHAALLGVQKGLEGDKA